MKMLIDIQQFLFSRDYAVSAEEKNRFCFTINDFFMAKKPEEERSIAFRKRNTWNSKDWLHYLESNQGSEEAVDLMDSYFLYHGIQEKSFQALVVLDEEAVSAGEPSFLLTNVEKHDWNTMERILTEVKKDALMKIYQAVFGSGDTVDFERTWNAIKTRMGF